MVTPVEEIDRVHDIAGTVMLGRRLPDADEAVGLRIRQRAEKDGVDDAENRRVGPNAEGKSEHRDCGEAGVAL